MIVFGPVPSRRLGYSLGINHVPSKNCSYSCVYCQVGRTNALGIDRKHFFPIDQIIEEVGQKIDETKRLGKTIDYLTLVPDGEPALDANLGNLINSLKYFEIPIAAISNASLISDSEVSDAFKEADWVSLKVDSTFEDVWRKIDRPFRRLSLAVILTGIIKFKASYHGKFVTETMLVSNLNDGDEAIRSLADYLLALQPSKSYLSIPTRPPAESWVRPPDSNSLGRILEYFSEKINFIDILFEAEAADFISTGDLEKDILSIAAVHPIREEAMHVLLSRANADMATIEKLLRSGDMVRFRYNDEVFFMLNYSKEK